MQLFYQTSCPQVLSARVQVQHQDVWRKAQDHLLAAGRPGSLGQHRDKVQEAGRGLPRGQVQEPELQLEEVQHQQAANSEGENVPRLRGQAPERDARGSGDPDPGGLLLPRS